MLVGGHSSQIEQVVRAIERLSQVLDQVCSEIPVEGLAVELKFHIAGQFVDPDFDGVKKGPFFRSLDALAILIAVPDSVKANEFPEYFKGVLSEALEIAERFAQTRKKRPLTIEPLGEAIRQTMQRLDKEGLAADVPDDA